MRCSRSYSSSRCFSWSVDATSEVEDTMAKSNPQTNCSNRSRSHLSSETAEQIAVVDFCDVMHIPIVHIPNEGKRSGRYGANLKRMGMRSGFPDLFIPIGSSRAHGLFIEMKYGDGKLSNEQRKWLVALRRADYEAYVCYNSEEAIHAIQYYISRTKGDIDGNADGEQV